jgi:hypothetical protein
MLVRTTRYFLKKLKEVPAESWIIKPEDAAKKYTDDSVAHLNVQSYREIKR